MKLISKLIEKLLNLKIVRSKKFYKLINSEKNYKRIDIPIIDIDDFYIHNDFKPKNKYFFSLKSQTIT